MSSPLRTTVLGLSLLALAVGCGPRSAPGTGRGVLLIAIDALRADHLGSAGYDRDTSPFLDSLARDGVSFSQAFTTAPWVLPAHVSLMTGCDPQIAKRVLPENVTRSVLTVWNVPEAAPRLAKEFLRHGFATAAFVDYPWIGSAQGFTQGYETFKGGEYGSPRRSELGVEAVGTRLEQWVRSRPAGQDWFAYMHLNDLERIWQQSDPQWDTYFQPRAGMDAVPPIGDADHTYFAIPRHRWSGGQHTLGEYEARYDGAIRRVDTALARIFTRLQQIDAFANTTVLVVGTHGLGFGEAGMILDHGTLSDVDLHVPLIVRPSPRPGIERGLVTDALASVMDVAPTLLDMHGLPVPSRMQGVSLAEALVGGESPRTYAFAHCALQEGYSVMDARWCFERRLPWLSREPELAFSWYGKLVENGVPEEVLHDRINSDSLSHWECDKTRPAIMDRLRTAGAEWEARVDAARRNLQSERWSEPVLREASESRATGTNGTTP